MSEKYYPPEYQARQFHCMHCNVFAAQHWFCMAILHPNRGYINTAIYACLCSHCGSYSFWEETSKKMFLPAFAPVAMPHTDLPAECTDDYKEAREVFSTSPRSAAALLRLCIQKLMIHLGEKGKNINDDIASLVQKGLSVQIQRALDICRVVGNNAVHPGSLDLNDSPEVASQLFGLINFIVEDRIAHPKQIAELYEKLPKEAREAIDKRDKITEKA